MPLERASRGDQLENARYFEARGLCHVLRERELTRPEALPSALLALFQDEALRARLQNTPVQNGTPAILRAIEETLGAF